MDLKGNLGDLMKQAQEMQSKLKQAQEQLSDLEVIGEAGAGMVKIGMSGRHQAKWTEIQDEALEEDKEVLQDGQTWVSRSPVRVAILFILCCIPVPYLVHSFLSPTAISLLPYLAFLLLPFFFM